MNRFRFWYDSLPPVLRVLMLVQVVVYLVSVLILPLIPGALEFVRSYLAVPGGSPLDAPWTILTYAFVHTRPGLGGFLEVAFNVAFLYWIGEEQERMLGGAWVLTAWGLGALGGGLVALALGLVYEGSQAAILGLIFATAIQFPYKTIGLLLLGAVRLLWVGIGLLAFELLGPPGYVFAGIGGALAGTAMGALALRGYHLHSWVKGAMDNAPSRTDPSPSRGRSAEPEPEAVSGWRAMGARLSDPKSVRRPSRHEVDRILEKISDEGLDALTDDEREVLDAYSKR